jgi:tRNA threonylcarbamoyladenosine modification (KEOPS) complex  Pcc1 subunit
MHSIEYAIELVDPKKLDIVLTNIKLELDDTERARTNISSEGTKLLISLEADDIVMLRAFSNSILRMISTITEIFDNINN